jgi:hypothetical protein
MYSDYRAPSEEVLAKYAAYLDDAYRSWPSWKTGTYGTEDESTHVELFTWHDDRTGWIGHKSNFEVARDLIICAADEGRTDTEVSDEQVYECGGGSSAWDVAQLFVQVYEGGCPEDCAGTHRQECAPNCDPIVDICYGQDCTGDCHGTRTYTAAFRTAVALVEHIEHEYPFLDEDDYDQQRREVFEKNLEEALDDVKMHFPYDTEADHKSIVEHGAEALYDLEYRDEDGHASWNEVREAYDEARDEHFLDLGRAFMRNEIPGQLALAVAGE